MNDGTLFAFVFHKMQQDKTSHDKTFQHKVSRHRGDATGTAGTATAVPNITQISSGLERFFYFVGQTKILVGFSSYYFCFKSMKESDPTYVRVHEGAFQ